VPVALAALDPTMKMSADFLLPSVRLASIPRRCNTDNTWNSAAKFVLYFSVAAAPLMV
jgi:hypothetical protein